MKNEKENPRMPLNAHDMLLQLAHAREAFKAVLKSNQELIERNKAIIERNAKMIEDHKTTDYFQPLTTK